MMKKLETYKRHAREFELTFGVKLMPSYWNHLTGFDLIAFDEEVVQPEDGESTREAVKRRFGEDAVDLLLKLMG